MKKLIFLLLFIPLFNCSDGEDIVDNSPNTEDVSLQMCVSVTIEYPNYCGGEITSAYSFNYDGNKIISGSLQRFYYSPSVFLDCTEVDSSESLSEFENTYSNDKLITKTTTKSNYTSESGYKTVIKEYEYNNDGLIANQTTNYYDVNGNNVEVTGSSFLNPKFYNWINNNLTRQLTDEAGNVYMEFNYDSNYNQIKRYSYIGTTLRSEHTAVYEIDKYDPFFNSHEDFKWDTNEITGRNGKNPVLSINKINWSPDENGALFPESYDVYRENTYDENDFLTVTTETRTDEESYLKVIRFYYD